MRKPPLQDVIVKSQDSIRRPRMIPERYVTDESQNSRPVHAVGAMRPGLRPISDTETEFESEEEFRPRVNDALRERRGAGGTGTSKKWLLTALGIGFVVVLSSVGLSLLFAGATVTVHPKQDTVVVNANFTAGAGDSSLPFERIVLERTAQQEVTALGEEEVHERASGKITIYNEYSDTPQRLIKNTRFQSNENRIYRIQESVEIPGKATNGTAGSIEVTVFAEEPGETYNIAEPETFSIPGFQGLPQEKLVYAKSNGVIEGGFEGVRKSVNEAERAEALKALETQLRDELLSVAFSESDKPEGYHMFKEAVFFEFNPLPDESTETDKVTLKLSGKLHGVLFPRDAFAKRTAQVTLSSYSDSPIRIDNLEELSVTVHPQENTESVEETETSDSEETETSDENSTLPWQASTYSVAVQGKAHFIWEFDEKALAQDFAGKEKEILNTPSKGGIVEGYPGIDRLEVSVRPFWKSTFPETAEDIVVITKLDD